MAIAGLGIFHCMHKYRLHSLSYRAHVDMTYYSSFHILFSLSLSVCVCVRGTKPCSHNSKIYHFLFLSAPMPFCSALRLALIKSRGGQILVIFFHQHKNRDQQLRQLLLLLLSTNGPRRRRLFIWLFAV